MKNPGLKPSLHGKKRKTESDSTRAKASAVSRTHLPVQSNGEIERYAGVWPTNFTKGLPHTVDGIVEADAFCRFVDALNKNDVKFDVPLGPRDAMGKYRPKGYKESSTSVTTFQNPNLQVRGWESPGAGHVFDLEGPDAGSVGMSAAPELGSDELAAEMAEVYGMALLRDVEFEKFRGESNADAKFVVESLGSLPWFDKSKAPVDAENAELGVQARRRRSMRLAEDEHNVSGQSLFRGSTFGCMQGPYISQFLLLGNASRDGTDADENPNQGMSTAKEAYVLKTDTGTFEKSKMDDGYISYGAQRIDQRVTGHEPGRDYLTDWTSWLDVQNGADTRGADRYKSGAPRFVSTPRDLATYVHFDALYQAYLNACLFLLAIDAKTDSGMPEGGSHPTRSAFATFGGPHVLTLVTETATRSLKAVRRQKYNYHLRARPEVVGAVAALAKSLRKEALGGSLQFAEKHLTKLECAADKGGEKLLERINKHNEIQNGLADSGGSPEGWAAAPPDINGLNYLLPMAFPEGSPMHPSYGAGHATVAGSCVTILKTFFETFKGDSWEPLCMNEIGGKKPIQNIYVPDEGGLTLKVSSADRADELTLIGELNKLAANISIGRNMAGVHYYSDYYDSLRMGERIAVGMLQEQMYTYPEKVKMRLMSFDDDKITIAASASGVVELIIEDRDGQIVSEDDWFGRHVGELVQLAKRPSPGARA